MLQQNALVILLIQTLLFAITFYPSQNGSNPLIKRITSTSEQGINLNPSISGDGRHITFESTEDLLDSGSSIGFRSFRADVSAERPTVEQIALSRAVAAAISQDGSSVAFASTEDLVGKNADRNSEIFLFHDAQLDQITDTLPESIADRLFQGSFEPSIADDGLSIAFSSNRNLAGLNPEFGSHIFLYDSLGQKFVLITSSERDFDNTNAKISGNGSRVAYIRTARNIAGGRRELMLRIISTGQTQLIAGNVGPAPLTYGRAISDDGMRVVYSTAIAENRSEVFLYDDRFKSVTQITSLPARANDVPLHASLSGDGQRIVFASRRDVIGFNKDHSVELYAFDVPSGQFLQLTDVPAEATAEVVSALNDDGSVVVFSFPRLLSAPTSSTETANNSEIYTVRIPERSSTGELTVLNAASAAETVSSVTIAPDSIAIGRGSALAMNTTEAQLLPDATLPFSLGGSTVKVNGRLAMVLYASREEIQFIVPASTEPGVAEIVVTNADGYPSLATITVQKVVPGIFTSSGDGSGEALAVDEDTLLPGPFDPTDARTRVILFATGMRNSNDSLVSLAAGAIKVDTVVASPDLPGLDEIHLLIPSDLRGLGSIPLTLITEGVQSNTVTITLSGNPLRDIVLNELLTDPPNDLAGDANHDGIRDSSDDEFVELVNTTTRDIDLSGYQLETTRPATATPMMRHRFTSGTIFPAGTAIVIFGGGSPDPMHAAFHGAQVIKASSGGLSLLNSDGIVTLRNPTGLLVTFASYGGSSGLPGGANQSLTRSPDLIGAFTLHQTAPASDNRPFSPGTRLNGEPFFANPAISRILISSVLSSLNPGDEMQFTAKALNQNGDELADVLFTWTSSEQNVLKINQSGLATAVGPGSSEVRASARGVKSDGLLVNVVAVPVPSPTVAPSPSPMPTPTPSPDASPSPTPPAPVPASIVISQIYAGGGNSGAPFRNDFVEIFNRGSEVQSLRGWSVQYASATGGNWAVTALPEVMLAPGQYLLIQESSGGANGMSLPVPDVIGTIAMAASAGKVALLNTADALTGPCPVSTAIVDLVGYGGAANCFRGGGPAAAPGNTTAVLRKQNGCVDTQNNTSDFETAEPMPRNSGVSVVQCVVAARTSLHLSSVDPIPGGSTYGWKFQSGRMTCPPLIKVRVCAGNSFFSVNA